MQEQFVTRFHWEPGSIAFWDNRATWHLAQNDYQGQRREMHRITIEGCALF
jgi:taurine dioxygenase